MFGVETVWDRPLTNVTERDVEEYRPVPARVLEREETMDADREEWRDEGGAYWEDGRGGYGSMIKTSWTEEVPKPI